MKATRLRFVQYKAKGNALSSAFPPRAPSRKIKGAMRLLWSWSSPLSSSLISGFLPGPLATAFSSIGANAAALSDASGPGQHQPNQTREPARREKWLLALGVDFHVGDERGRMYGM